MESKEWLGYSYHFGSDPKIEQIMPQLLIEKKVRRHIEMLFIEPIKIIDLKKRIQDHLVSVRTSIRPNELKDYEWWINTHLIDDNISYRVKKYAEEYYALEKEAIICLFELEKTDKKRYLSTYERYLMILREMNRILFIKNGIKNNQNEPPDIA